MSKNKNRHKTGSPYYWQSDAYNSLCYHVNVNMLLSIACNRFRWVGLPSTCDPRFLEMQLHRNGIATICHDKETPDVWVSLMAMPQSPYNLYGLPVAWKAKGFTDAEIDVTPDNGELVYYSQTRTNIWSALTQYATKLTHIQRTADVNLLHQQKPWIMVAPQEKKLELVNIYKQVSGFEPAILGDQSLLDLKEDNVFTLDTQVPFIGAELNEMYQNVLNQFLLYIGVPHVSFEKSERLVRDEIDTSQTATNILLKNCLDSRRWACEKLRELDYNAFKDANVYLNNDFESSNYNFANSLEQQAESGLLESEVDNG